MLYYYNCCHNTIHHGFNNIIHVIVIIANKYTNSIILIRLSSIINIVIISILTILSDGCRWAPCSLPMACPDPHWWAMRPCAPWWWAG